jgi:threonine synthase
MDIMVSSNFERALFECHQRDAAAVADFMARSRNESLSIDDASFARLREHFDSYAVNDEVTVATIAQVFDESEYLLDPHSAIGVKAARECWRDRSVPMITLATAHPAKFPEAIIKSGQENEPALPHHMADLFAREERYTVLPKDLPEIQAFIDAQVVR